MAVRTVKYCLRHVQKRLMLSGIDEPMSNSKFLVAHALGQKTLTNITPSQRVTKTQWAHVQDLTEKKLSGIPVQYLIGDWDFHSITLQMKPPVFIPRPEGEVLIEHILGSNEIQSASRFLEVGSGTGALCLALLHANKQLHAVAIDVSQDACELTKCNAEELGVSSRLTVINTQVKGFGRKLFDMGLEKLDFLISNPPYINSKEMESLPDIVAKFEDKRALHGGLDGLDVVREIIDEVPHLLHGGGTVWLEVDSKHPPMLEELVSQEMWRDLTYVKTIPDMRNMSRFCQLRFMKNGQSSSGSQINLQAS